MRRTGVAVVDHVIGGLCALEHSLGWDVAAHHAKPLTDFPPDELPGVVDGIQRWLAQNGFGAGGRHLAYPLGKHDPRVLALVRGRFATARLASGGAETLPPADPHRLRAMNVLDSTPPEALVAAARRAREEREWLILMFHFLVDSPRRETEYAIESFREAIAGIAGAGVAVRPVSEVDLRGGAQALVERLRAPTRSCSQTLARAPVWGSLQCARREGSAPAPERLAG